MQGVSGNAESLPQAGPAETQAQAGNQAAQEQALRIHHSRPTVFEGAVLEPGSGNERRYNEDPAMPAKHSTPSEYKDRLAVKNDLIAELNRDGAAGGGQGVMRTAPITEDEINFVRQTEAEKRLEEFDAYVQTLIDPRKPGNLQWLMEVYPDFVERRVKQIHDDHQYAMKNALIDGFGVNSFNDLFFKYNVDQGIIGGPMLRREENAAQFYQPGSMSFIPSAHDRPALPYSSAASYGHAPRPYANYLRVPHRMGGDKRGFIQQILTGQLVPALDQTRTMANRDGSGQVMNHVRGRRAAGFNQANIPATEAAAAERIQAAARPRFVGGGRLGGGMDARLADPLG